MSPVRLVALAALIGACRAPEPGGAALPPSAPSAAAELPSAPPVPSVAPEPPSATAQSSGDAPPAPPRELDGMLIVPAGSFVMGNDAGGEPDEGPAHRVTLPAYYLDATEVTNEDYGACVAARRCGAPNPKSADASSFGPDRRFRHPRQPVSSVSWDDATSYCAWRDKRLPSEAELERAARGDDGRAFPWGNDPPSRDRAVYQSDVTAEVATHPAGDGPFGHHDLAGNVWEWAADPYDPFAYRRDGAARGEPSDCEHALAALDELRKKKTRGFTGTNPLPSECERVLRGGAFNYPPAGLRSSNRVHHPARYHLVMSGFRCARSLR